VKFHETDLPGVVLIEPDVHRDDRGFFLETYSEERYREGGIEGRFVQDNHSRSVKSTLRGLHAQVERPQAKLVRVIEGEVYDVAVDIRRGSPHFGQYFGARLSSENFLQLYIPAGFAHGFCVTSPVCQLEYKCSDYYVREAEIAIAWNDPEIGIAWPVSRPLLSDRDRDAPTLAGLGERLPRYEG
jgi:dTDP-4-dehydrorhamnose 3,5-epimerase